MSSCRGCPSVRRHRVKSSAQPAPSQAPMPSPANPMLVSFCQIQRDHFARRIQSPRLRTDHLSRSVLAVLKVRCGGRQWTAGRLSSPSVAGDTLSGARTIADTGLPKRLDDVLRTVATGSTVRVMTDGCITAFIVPPPSDPTADLTARGRARPAIARRRFSEIVRARSDVPSAAIIAELRGAEGARAASGRHHATVAVRRDAGMGLRTRATRATREIGDLPVPEVGDSLVSVLEATRSDGRFSVPHP